MLFKVLILFPMSPNHNIAQSFNVSKIRNYMLATLAECDMHNFDQQIITTRVIGYTALVTRRSRSQINCVFFGPRGASKLSWVNKLAVVFRKPHVLIIKNMFIWNLITQTKPDIVDCVCLLPLAGLGVRLGRAYPPRYLHCHGSRPINTGGRCRRLAEANMPSIHFARIPVTTALSLKLLIKVTE